MTNHPDVLHVSIALNSNAAANTAQDDTILAAPGAGNRYRIFGISHAQVQNNAANTMLNHVNAGGLGSIGGDIYLCSIKVDTSDTVAWYPQGIPLSDNQALSHRNFSTAAGPLSYRIVVHYVIENS